MLLSVDLYSPHVKNKMSKREFIRNNYQVLNGGVARDCLGDCYDDVYLNGHIVAAHHRTQQVKRKGGKKQHCFPCLLYTSPSPRDATLSRMPSSA